MKDVKDKTGEVRPRTLVSLSYRDKSLKKLTKSAMQEDLEIMKRCQNHWFRGMKLMVNDIVRLCPVCIAIRGRSFTKEVLAPDARPVAFGDRWHINGLKPPESVDYNHLLGAVDAATKSVILHPAKGETAQTTTDILMETTNRFGRPS